MSERKGLFEEAQRRHALPGRDRRRVARHAGQAAARAAGARGGARGHLADACPVDVRVVAATHRDLEGMVEDGAFRKDLYFRLKVFQIRVPELKDRPEDVPALAGARWRGGTSGWRRTAASSASATRRSRCMQAYDWPGNVRELMTAIEYACIVCEGGRILAHHLPEEVREGAMAGAPATLAASARPGRSPRAGAGQALRGARRRHRARGDPSGAGGGGRQPHPRRRRPRAWAAPRSGRSSRSTGCEGVRKGGSAAVRECESGKVRKCESAKVRFPAAGLGHSGDPRRERLKPPLGQR